MKQVWDDKKELILEKILEKSAFSNLERLVNEFPEINSRILLTHVAQLHKLTPDVKRAFNLDESSPETIEKIVYSQFHVARAILDNPKRNTTLIFMEGLTENLKPQRAMHDAKFADEIEAALSKLSGETSDTAQIHLSHLIDYMSSDVLVYLLKVKPIRDIFPHGLPHNFAELNEQQKKVLAEMQAPYLLYYLNEINTIYRTSHPILHEYVLSHAESLDDYPLVYVLREQVALHYINATIREMNLQKNQQVNVYWIMGAAHSVQKSIQLYEYRSRTNYFYYQGKIDTLRDPIFLLTQRNKPSLPVKQEIPYHQTKSLFSPVSSSKPNRDNKSSYIELRHL